MLNASRRHRLGHDGPAVVVNADGSAQRLSASQTWSPFDTGGEFKTVSGAQRLSASQTWSPCVPGRTRAAAKMCSTPLGVTDLVTRGDGAYQPTLSAECSTPLGVTDLVTGRGGLALIVVIVVLNASRRHRLGHAG